MSVPAFGAEMRSAEFPHLLPEVAFLGHGAYGSVSKTVRKQRDLRMAEYECDPDTYIRRLSYVYWEDSRKAVAEFVGASVDNLALVQNTTTGINSALKSLKFEPGDIILKNGFTYGATANTIGDAVARNTGASTLTINHEYPITSTDQIIEDYDTVLKANPNIKLAVIDHISSNPAIQFPLSQLIPLCHSYDVMVCIDGAHAVGQVPLNLDELQPDFYAGSLHKWVYTSRACGILYSLPKYHASLKPAVASWIYEASFPLCFFRQGFRDDTQLFVVKEALEFYQSIGGLPAISAYNADLGSRMADMLASAWGTSRFEIPPELEAPSIKMVQLPELPDYPVTFEGGFQLMLDVRDFYNIWVAFVHMKGSFYARICTQIYCVENDYHRLGDAILGLKSTPASKRPERPIRYPKMIDRKEIIDFPVKVIR